MGVARTRVRPRNDAEGRQPAASVAGPAGETFNASGQQAIDTRPVAQLTAVVPTPTVYTATCADSAALETCRDLLHAAEAGHLVRRPSVDEASISQGTKAVPSPARHGAYGSQRASMRQARIELHSIRNPANQNGDGVRADIVPGANLTAPAHDPPARQQCTRKPSAHTDFDRIEDTVDGSRPGDDRTRIRATHFAMLIAPPTGDASRLCDSAALVLAHGHMNCRGEAGNYLRSQATLERAVSELTGAVLTPTGDCPVLQQCTAMPRANAHGLDIDKPFNALGSGDEDGRFVKRTEGLTPAVNIAVGPQCTNGSPSSSEAHGFRQSDHSTGLKPWHEGTAVTQRSAIPPATRAAVRVQRARVESTGSDTDDIANGRAATGIRRQLEFGASAAAERTRNPHHDAHGTKLDVAQDSRPCPVAHPATQQIEEENGDA